MHYFSKLRIFLTALFIFIFLQFTSCFWVHAQGEDPIFPWNVELRTGAAVPTADFAETVNVGFDVGARLGYSIRERLMLRADLETELYKSELGFDDIQLWNYSGGLEYLFTDRGLTDWRLSGHLGLGATSVIVDDPIELSGTYLSINYGVKFGKGITDNSDWFVSLMGRTVFANPDDYTSYGTFVSVPITIGINHRFNLSDQSLKDKLDQPPVE